MKTPFADDLRFAAEWLREYEDEPGGADSERAAAVANWLDTKADEAELRSAAREHGVPVAKLRNAFQSADNSNGHPGESTAAAR